METQQCHQLVDRPLRLPQGAGTYWFTPHDSAWNGAWGPGLPLGLTPLLPCSWAALYADLTLVAAGATATFRVELSPDGIVWHTSFLHDLTAAQNKWIQAANLVVNANATAVLLGISNPAPYVRVGVVIANNPIDFRSLWLVTES